MQPLRTTISYLRLIKSELNPTQSNHNQQVDALDRAVEVLEEIQLDVEMR